MITNKVTGKHPVMIGPILFHMKKTGIIVQIVSIYNDQLKSKPIGIVIIWNRWRDKCNKGIL